ncbi:hypothetical protein ADIARSV_2951 [Arcticibacter svalbardensis MN12-7]|uniref:Uncharacterized protein n=1 Tax=Arcticibacter svalbardensis MN12-7 TaxID=1150600 RepID=R9GQ84_9SPHI|nr:hypothetical protein [Arcticibacter svalbardensis]EOR93883.1 hypothetical protein ADIARSV_2951 [Arcticibacter svalbardensis MN12-7]
MGGYTRDFDKDLVNRIGPGGIVPAFQRYPLERMIGKLKMKVFLAADNVCRAVYKLPIMPDKSL